MKLSGGLSRVSAGRSMAKEQGQFDNHFTPGSQAGRDGEDERFLFAVILVVLVVGAIALGRLAC